MSFLPSTYFVAHQENRMKNEGDLALARNSFINNKPNNLDVLLYQRYHWMNEYLQNASKVYELGCGAGFSKIYLKNPNLKLTDVSGHEWVDQYVDALNLPFVENSVDALICSHMIHHLAHPKRFFQQAKKTLKVGGLILISEIETSFVTKLLLRMMRHEGWSYDIDVFNDQDIANDPKDPWSANCAIPQLLFQDVKRFESEIPGFRVIKNELTEFAIFPLSGGVIAKSPTIPLPKIALKLVCQIDRLLIAIAPQIFAMGRRVVLQRIK